jgi:ABC-type Fe3+/spermidine/putrescine transport system ATPase subunit
MLEVEHLRKNYDDIVAVDDLSFEVDPGEFVTLLGPSGCGKSTTLHSIAGLVAPTAGTIRLDGRDVTDVPPNERNVGLVFQNRALFPHMTVEENVQYGLKMNGFDDEAIERRTAEYLDLVEMTSHSQHTPDELSGGQQQRVSLARALVYEPDVLLLDEPLTGLDRVLRERMRNEITKIHDAVDVTTVYVTHDQQEALAMSDRIIVLADGRAQQIASPKELYHTPSNPFVAEFIGKSTKFEGRLVSTDPPVVRNGTLDINITDVDSGREEYTLYVRPEDLTISPAGATTKANSFSASVTYFEYLGDRTEMEVAFDDGKVVQAATQSFPEVEIGDEVSIEFDPEDVIVV